MPPYEALPVSWPGTIAILLASYFLGSIPFGLLLTRFAGLGDIRAIGSGNIGATNVLRTGHKGLAAATLLLDGLKGTAAVMIGWRWGMGCAFIAAIAVYLGHCFPVWLKFKGGKGVATFLGVLAALHWPTAAVTAIVWLGVAVVTRYSSLSALIASVAAPIVLLLFGLQEVAALTALLTIIIWIKHRANLKRLLAGEESRIGAKEAAHPSP